MKTKLLLILFILSTMTGCAGVFHKEPKMTYHGDVNFSQPQRECIAAATEQWLYQTDGIASIDVVYDFDYRSELSRKEHLFHNRLVNWNGSMEEVQAADSRACGGIPDAWEAGCGIMGQTEYDVQHWPIPVEVRLVTDRFRDQGTCKSTAMHEFGHGFGMEHTKDKHDVMYWAIQHPPNTCFSTGDLIEFCAHNDCGPFIPKGC